MGSRYDLGEHFEGFDYVLSSAPMRELIAHVTPRFPEHAFSSSQHLGYRDFLTVVLICKDEDAFTDNWIYIHDPSVKVGRIQNFKSWSPYMVPDPAMACYGLEYFCFEGDGLWTSSDEDLINLAKKEIQQIGLQRAARLWMDMLFASQKLTRCMTIPTKKMWKRFARR
jgi:protoporphyrinogen oxidase